MRSGTRIVVAAFLVVVGAWPAWAQSAPATAVTALDVTRAGETLTASGSAVFAEPGTAPLGTDPAGDMTPPGLGLDLTSADIGDAGDMLTFTVRVADATAEPLFTVPEAAHYLWHIRVTNGTQSARYQLMAMRSGQYNRTVPFPDYLFRVNACSSTASGEPSCFTVAANVTGTMANGIVEWHVPKNAIAALPGAVIDVPPTKGPNPLGVESALGASGATYVRGSDAAYDVILPEPFVVGPAVAIGIRRATAQAGSVVFNVPASVGPDGTFAAKLAAPKLPGDYVLTARACHGAASECGYGEALVTVP